MKIISKTETDVIMEYVEGQPIHMHKNGASGLWFHAETIPTVIDTIVLCRQRMERIIVEYGSQKTGQAWEPDAAPNTGTIGRSIGEIQVPLLIRTKWSIGGDAIHDHCIVRILTAKGKHVIWQHPNYTPHKE